MPLSFSKPTLRLSPVELDELAVAQTQTYGGKSTIISKGHSKWIAK